MMPGGHTPFGTRVFGNLGPVIDPGTLGPVLYLSGLPSDGPVSSGGFLTNWFDKVANYNFTPSTGSIGIGTYNNQEGPGVWSALMYGGSFFAGMDAHGSLPSFPNGNGYTQYLLASGIGPDSHYGVGAFFWPVGTTGLGLILQAPGFNGGGGNFWTFGTVPAGNVVIKDGSSGFDTGIATDVIQSTWSLWTLVSDGVSKTTVYRNGMLGLILNTGAVGLGSNLTFGGPSAGASYCHYLMSSYILYTAQHTPGQIAGVRRWFRQHYGV